MQKRNSQDTSHLRAHFLVFQMDSTGRKIKKIDCTRVDFKISPHPILTNGLPLLIIDEWPHRKYWNKRFICAKGIQVMATN